MAAPTGKSKPGRSPKECPKHIRIALDSVAASYRPGRDIRRAGWPVGHKKHNVTFVVAPVSPYPEHSCLRLHFQAQIVAKSHRNEVIIRKEEDRK
ncbi:hypothetical protein ACO22_05788 [Paracoccidioides brasiliensis]|uniref:Uncharacterized protein n=1 Tax=Paracoccidioides brasiliensis TaxID=121759 RepID=A0A1D2J9B9_PARBR|nr:hypothetical protein ACO22_05788 [Paracoccidioides brasiliensis]ODH48168.1 hypothetical protein GX48_05764 [Paracoccidioides brasiliensis]